MNIKNLLTKTTIIRGLIALGVVIVLVVSLMLGLTRCNKDDTPVKDDSQQNTQTPETDTPEPETEQPENELPEESEPVQNNPVQNTPVQNKPVQNNPVQNTPTTTTPVVKSFTVTFKDHIGNVLKTQTVKEGEDATPPQAPARANFNFAGWDKAYTNVKSDLVITATYSTDAIVISAESVNVNKGVGEVTMNVRVINNPGIMGAVLKLSVDDKVFELSGASSTQFPGLTLTAPGPKAKASPYTFMLDSVDLSDADKKDGTLFTVTFKIKDVSASGKYNVTLSYDKGAIFDEKYKEPKVVLENGTITIK